MGRVELLVSKAAAHVHAHPPETGPANLNLSRHVGGGGAPPPPPSAIFDPGKPFRVNPHRFFRIPRSPQVSTIQRRAREERS